MKKRFIFIIIIMLFNIAYGFSLSLKDKDIISENSFYDCYRAIDNRINVRVKPNTNCKILGQVNENDEVYVNIENSNDSWLFCYIPNLEIIGYCCAKYFAYKPDFEGDIKEKYYNDDAEIINEFKNKHIGSVYFGSLIENDLINFSEDKSLRIVKNIYESNNFEVGYNTTILISAAKLNNYNIAEYLVSKEDIRKEINDKYNQYAPALFWALYKGNYEIAKLFLENGADPNFYTVSSKKAFDCLDEFVQYGDLTIVKSNELKELLVEYGYKK